MKEQSNIEHSELLTLIVDDEATERQKTEFKRLAQNNPELEKELQAMRRQKQLVNALPVESAPGGMAADITAALERKLILSDFNDSEPVSKGISHLMLRRLLTHAAMVLVPLGLLSLVVWQIIKPAKGGPSSYVVTDQIINEDRTFETSDFVVAENLQYPFDGILTFRTNQQMTLSNYAEKAVVDLGLLSSTVLIRNVDVTTFQVTASPMMVTKLIDSLETVWPHCQDVELSIVKDSEDNTIDISDVRAEQIKALAVEDSPESLNVMARQFAIANDKKNNDTEFALTRESNPGSVDSIPPLSVPIPTGRQEVPKAADQSQSKVRLRIHIRRTVE
jgi:hypothetical protein